MAEPGVLVAVAEDPEIITTEVNILSTTRWFFLSKSGKNISTKENKPKVNALKTGQLSQRIIAKPIPIGAPVLRLTNLIDIFFLPIVCPVCPCRMTEL